MRIGLSHSRYIANKIAIDLSRNQYISFIKGIDSIIDKTQELIYENLKKEDNLEKRVNEIIEENEDEIEYLFADEKELFRMIKKKFALEEGFLLNQEERFSDLSHKIAKSLITNKLIDFKIKENLIKNIIFDAIEIYLNEKINVEDKVLEKLQNYKRRIIPGTEEYNIIFQKLYEEELRLKGMR